jgi:hypothetical protein
VPFKRRICAIRLESISRTKSVDHGMRGAFDIDKAIEPDATVATYRIENEHGVVDARTGEGFELDLGRYARFGMPRCKSGTYGDVCIACQFAIVQE